MFLLTLVTVLLEASFLGAWRPFGIIPNLFLVLVLAAGASSANASEVLAIAVGGGFLLDIISGADFGLKTAYFCFLALLIVMMRRTGAEFERLGMKLAAILSATLLYNAVVLLPLLSSHRSVAWGSFVSKLATEAAVNLVLMAVLAWPLVWFINLGASSSIPAAGQE